MNDLARIAARAGVALELDDDLAPSTRCAWRKAGAAFIPTFGTTRPVTREIRMGAPSVPP